MNYVKRKYVEVFTLGVTGGLIFANALVFRTLFPKPMEKWKRKKYECAVVCGYPALENGKPSPEMKKRVEAAVALWRQNKVDVLILSGGAVANTYVEAEVMAKYARMLGVTEESILLEKESVSTYHNMVYSKKLMDQNQFKNCVVVTNGWHLRKADHYANRAGMDYVMYRTKKIKGEKFSKTIWRYFSTNLHMFFKFYEGLY